MKNKKNKKEDNISLESIVDSITDVLLVENEILRKKCNNQKLTPKEQFFDNYVFPPSIMVRLIFRRFN